MKFIASGQSLDARVEGLDLPKPLSNNKFKQLEQALSQYGVLSYLGQELTSLTLKNFTERVGRSKVNIANLY
jgi:taurine dioxygenase